MSERYCYICDAQAEGRRIDVFLAEETDLSRSRVKSLVDGGNVFVNTRPASKSGYLLKEGDRVEVEVPPETVLSAEPQDIPLSIVYQDADLAVINKPQGMVTHPAVGSPDGTLVNAAVFHIRDLSTINGTVRPGIVHRLDKDTSGLIVIAKNDVAHRSLALQIAEKSCKRCYIALLDGNLKEDRGVVEQPIGRHKTDRKKMAVVQGGRYAKTYFEVKERFGRYTLAAFELATGRTHQIRVHAAYLRHPVVGDPLYGGSNAFGLNGQLLHAQRLSFTHPVSGERMTFEAPLPPHFERVLQKLRASFGSDEQYPKFFE